MRARNNVEEVANMRMLGIEEAAAYIGMGRNATRAWMDRIGATRKIGRRVLFDKNIVDRALDQLEK